MRRTNVMHVTSGGISFTAITFKKGDIKHGYKFCLSSRHIKNKVVTMTRDITINLQGIKSARASWSLMDEPSKPTADEIIALSLFLKLHGCIYNMHTNHFIETNP